jgi:pimeloyl-ACP methyl ester carboxylesterase
VINHLRNEFGVSNVYLWGRSMGAATAILYTAKYGGIKAIISDNSYADLDLLVNDLSDDYLPFLPTFLLDGIINSIQDYIEEMLWKTESTDFNLRKLKPKDVVHKITCPIVYIGSTEDTFVDVKHTKDLYAKTKSSKWLELVKGNHNDPRTIDTKVKVFKYMQEIKEKHLKVIKTASRE